MNRVRRNFWSLVTATVVAVGLLSTVVRMPPSPFTGTLTAIVGLAAATSLALAGRILVVVSRSRTVAGTGDRRHEPTSSGPGAPVGAPPEAAPPRRPHRSS